MFNLVQSMVFCGIPQRYATTLPEISSSPPQLQGQQTQHHLPLQGLFTGAHRSVVALEITTKDMATAGCGLGSSFHGNPLNYHEKTGFPW